MEVIKGGIEEQSVRTLTQLMLIEIGPGFQECQGRIGGFRLSYLARSEDHSKRFAHSCIDASGIPAIYGRLCGLQQAL